MIQIWSKKTETPNWSVIQPKDFETIFPRAIESSLLEIDDIVNQEKEANFENTILALERSGKSLKQIQSIFYVYCSNLNIGEMPEIEKRVRELLVEYQNKINQNQALFSRISKVYEDKDSFAQEEQRLLENIFVKYIRSGAKLEEKNKKTLSLLHRKIQGLQILFKQNILLLHTNSTGMIVFTYQKS